MNNKHPSSLSSQVPEQIMKLTEKLRSGQDPNLGHTTQQHNIAKLLTIGKVWSELEEEKAWLDDCYG